MTPESRVLGGHRQTRPASPGMLVRCRLRAWHWHLLRVVVTRPRAADIPRLPLRSSSAPSHLRAGPLKTRTGSLAGRECRWQRLVCRYVHISTNNVKRSRRTSSMDIHLPSHPRVASRPSTSLTMAMEAICRAPPRDPHIPTGSVQPKMCTPSPRTTTGARRLRGRA